MDYLEHLEDEDQCDERLRRKRESAVQTSVNEWALFRLGDSRSRRGEVSDRDSHTHVFSHFFQCLVRVSRWHLGSS